jgi:hypothetical protein
MTADDSLDQPFMRKVIQTFRVAITLASGAYQRKVFRMPGLKKPLLQEDADFLGMAAAGKPATGDGVTIFDQPHGLFGSHELPLH